MHYYEVAPIKIIRSEYETFTYSLDVSLSIGQIVLIEVGKNKIVGVIFKETKKPIYNTKQIISIIYQKPIPIQLLKTTKWISEYYVSPLALVLQTILPRGIQKNRKIQKKVELIVKRNRTNILFNKEQSEVLKTLDNSDYGTYLLQGVTGSGKTEIYINIAKRSINIGKSVIILVPEIALTSQIISEFSNTFDDILVTHSQMTEAERHVVWQEALNSEKPRVVIGPRSAIFTPLKDIGAIIIDEAHEQSYKQDQSPKYSTLRVATIIGRYFNAKVIFGSATPNIIDRYLADRSDNKVLKLTKVARIDSKPPNISVVDMKDRQNFSKHRFLSKQLIEQIDKTLKEKKQILIFHNRRGSANITLCKNCGWTAMCPKCYLPLTLHSDKHLLKCHICGYYEKVPSSCPKCNNAEIIFKGIGTKLIESEIRRMFPNANVARFDADNSIKDTVNNRYKELYGGTIDIIIGTQIIAKGLDLPELRTVGIIQADTGLTLPDFNSSERTFQLLAQVVGRVGRNNTDTQVIVQTYQPKHPSIEFGLKQDYESFYNYVLDERKKAIFPPFTYLLKLVCIYKTESAAINNSKKFAEILKGKIEKSVQILGPTPAFYEYQYNTYRWQLVLKSPKREYLIKAIEFLPNTHWQYEMDPTSLL